MIRRRTILKSLRWTAVSLPLAAPIVLLAHSLGPDPGHSGVPGESTCLQCHTPSGAPGTGSVAVTGFGSGMTYVPGVPQTLTVTVSDPVQRRWGFQLTARATSNAGQQEGTFTPGTDGFTQLSCGAPPFANGFFQQQNIDYENPICASSLSTLPMQYVEHTQPGTRLGQTGSASFTFQWTPPCGSDNITIYVAGNAANGDGTNFGDHIYLASYALSPAASPALSAAVNGAGFQSTIAPGSWVALTGCNLSTTTRTWQASDFTNNGQSEPAALDGVSVSMGGLPAYVYYISPTQINVQAPSVTTGPVSVQVSNGNGVSASFSAAAAAESPAFFLWNGKYAVATRPDFTYVGPPGLFSTVATTPAKPGDTVILWGTGFGPTTPALPPGTLTPQTSATVNDPVAVTVGGLSAQYLGGAMTPGTAGLCQIVIQVPASAPNGDLPVVATIDGVQSPSGVFLTIQQ